MAQICTQLNLKRISRYTKFERIENAPEALRPETIRKILKEKLG